MEAKIEVNNVGKAPREFISQMPFAGTINELMEIKTWKI